MPGPEISPCQDNPAAGSARTLPGMLKWSQTLFRKLLEALDCTVVLIPFFVGGLCSQLCLTEDPLDETKDR